MANITPVEISATLTKRAFTAASSGGDKIVPPNSSSQLILEFKNTNVAARTVTITAQITSREVPDFGPMTLADKVLALAQDEEAVVKIPRSGFNDAADANKIAVTYDSEVGVSLRAFAI